MIMLPLCFLPDQKLDLDRREKSLNIPCSKIIFRIKSQTIRLIALLLKKQFQLNPRRMVMMASMK